ncbi:MAG: amidohydrolase family protein [Candidatus Sigynarchaeota archaeon]
MIEFRGVRYSVFDVHTHWSNLVCKVLRGVLEMAALPEVLDLVFASWSDVESRTRSRSERNMEFFPLVLDRFGIDRAVLLPVFGFDVGFNIEIGRRFPGRVTSFGAVPPRVRDAERRFERMREAGVKGLKLHANYHKFSPRLHAAELSRLLGWCNDEGMIVLFHSGSHYEIRDLVPVLKPFDDLRVIIGHSGLGNQVDQAVAAAKVLPSAYLEVSSQPYSYMFERALKDPDIGVERFLFGSDLPGIHPLVEAMKVLQFPISEADKQLIFSGNAERLLDIRIAENRQDR